MNKLNNGLNNATNKISKTVRSLKKKIFKKSKNESISTKKERNKTQLKVQKDQNVFVNNVEHKYKLTCDLSNCEYHPKPNAYEEFLDNLWNPKLNRSLNLSNQDTDKFYINDLNKLNNKTNNLDQLNQLNQPNQLIKNSNNNELNLNDHKLSLDSLSNLPILPSGECSICFTKLQAPLEIMPCTHIFHLNCIKNWLEIKTTCPLCNCTIKQEQIQKYKERWFK